MNGEMDASAHVQGAELFFTIVYWYVLNFSDFWVNYSYNSKHDLNL